MIIAVIISYTLVLLALMAVIVFMEIKHKEEKADLQDRLAAKNLEEYKYYRLGYPTEVNAVKEKTAAELEDMRLQDETKRKAQEEFLKRKGGIDALAASRGF